MEGVFLAMRSSPEEALHSLQVIRSLVNALNPQTHKCLNPSKCSSGIVNGPARILGYCTGLSVHTTEVA